MERETGWTARGRALLGLALVASVLPAALAHAQSPYVETPPTPPSPPAPPPAPPVAEPAMMRPFPIVRTAGSFSRGATLFTRVAVKAPNGSVVSTRCRRARCTGSRTVRGGRTLRLRRLERAFPPRTVIEIRIGAPGLVGKHVELRIRAGRPPLRRDRCLPPGERPVPCTSG